MSAARVGEHTGQLVQMWRLDLLAAHEAAVSTPEIIGQHEDNVRARGGGEGAGGHEQPKCGEEVGFHRAALTW
jgi:hypothetical protein